MSSTTFSHQQQSKTAGGGSAHQHPSASDALIASGTSRRNHAAITYGAIIHHATGTGWSAESQRVHSLHTLGSLPLPPSVDLTAADSVCAPYPAVRTQGTTGNCSPDACCAALECVLRRQANCQEQHWITYLMQVMRADLTQFPPIPVWSVSQQSRARRLDPSISFVYYFARTIDGSVSHDSGTSVVAALTAMQSGVCSSCLWDNGEPVNAPPDEEARAQALFCNVLSFQQLRQSAETLQAALAAGFPIVFSFLVTRDIDAWFKDEQAQVRTASVLPVENQFALPDLLGGHTVLIVGYETRHADGEDGRFLCRNSWGATWGQRGHFYVAFRSVLNPRWAHNFYIVTGCCIRDTPPGLTADHHNQCPSHETRRSQQTAASQNAVWPSCVTYRQCQPVHHPAFCGDVFQYEPTASDISANSSSVTWPVST